MPKCVEKECGLTLDGVMGNDDALLLRVEGDKWFYFDCEWVLREGVLAREFPEFEMTTMNEATLVAQVLEATGKFDAVHIMTGTREELRAAIKKYLEDNPPERFISVQ